MQCQRNKGEQSIYPITNVLDIKDLIFARINTLINVT
jgi:hypothetical protein